MPQDSLLLTRSTLRHRSPANRGQYAGIMYGGKGIKPVHLYVAYCKGYAKIGITEAVKTRIAGMQSGCPFQIELLRSWSLTKSDAIEAESKALLSLDSAHWFGDWFKCSRATALYAASSAVKGMKLQASLEKSQLLERVARRIETPEGTFRSAAAAAKHFGVSRQAVSSKVSRRVKGWSFVE